MTYLSWAWALMRSKYGRIATLVIAALAGLGLAKWRLESNAVTRDRREQEVKAHDRINQADIGIGATDEQRAERLRDMADDWSRR